jgi:hypothetical protein
MWILFHSLSLAHALFLSEVLFGSRENGGELFLGCFFFRCEVALSLCLSLSLSHTGSHALFLSKVLFGSQEKYEGMWKESMFSGNFLFLFCLFELDMSSVSLSHRLTLFLS